MMHTSVGVGRSIGWIVAVAFAAAAARALGAQSPANVAYPPTPRGPQVDEFAGNVRVPDPYRWLEAVASTEVHNWIKAQNAVTESFFARVPNRVAIQAQVREAWSYPKLSAPFPGGDRLFFSENPGLDNQATLYVVDRREPGPRVLVDPNAFARDGLFAIVDQSPSPDGRYVAYAVSAQGSAWRTIRVRDVRSSQDLGEELQGIKESSLSWTKDARGFFYVRADLGRQPSAANPLAPDGRPRVFYHRAGQRQSEDQLVYEAPDRPDWRLRADVSDDGQYLVIAARSGTDLHNRLYFIDLDNPKRPNLNAPIVKLFDAPDALYEFVSSEGPFFFLRTTKNAPRARVVAVDINSPDESHWTTVARETYDPLIAAVRVDDRVVAHRLHDAHSVLDLYALNGAARGSVALPGVGTVTDLNPRTESRELYFTYSSFLQPPIVLRFDLEMRTTTPYKEARADSALAQFETTQLFFTSPDGTRVPMFITARRGITLDGTHPALLSGNGAFGVSSTPTFTPMVIAWLKMGGIHAVANVRGGGEYGRAWYEAATRTRKQTSFDDFIAAAEFLIGQRYTRSSLLAIAGHGNGGLLVGAAMTQRPDLFGAALIDAGLLDMARFNRFAEGAAWTREYGSPDNPADLKALLAYSPLHKIHSGTHHPATLITVGAHDDVFTPIHSYKFAATLQANNGTLPPALLRVDLDAGVRSSMPVGKAIAGDADRLAFLASALHIPR